MIILDGKCLHLIHLTKHITKMSNNKSFDEPTDKNNIITISLCVINQKSESLQYTLPYNSIFTRIKFTYYRIWSCNCAGKCHIIIDISLPVSVYSVQSSRARNLIIFCCCCSCSFSPPNCSVCTNTKGAAVNLINDEFA